MRRGLDRVVVVFAATSAMLSCGVLALLVVGVAARGLPTLSLEFLTSGMRAGGAEGGVVDNLIGTLVLVVTAAIVCTPLAVGTAVTHGFYLRSGRWRRGLELLLHALNGVPSILLGILGLIVFVRFLGWGKSWLGGGLLLALVMLPTVAVAMIERIRALPPEYVEAASALGLSDSQVVRAVLLPRSAGALLTGLLLGVARAAGETAPILFTATVFAGATWPTGIRDSPVLSLPYHVFVLAQDSYDPRVSDMVWGAATVLLLLVIALSAVALPFRLRLHDEARDG